MGPRVVFVWQVFLALVAALSCGGCQKDQDSRSAKSKDPSPASRKQAPPDRQWTPEDINKDPEGYLAWADARLESQVQDRRDRLEALNQRLKELRTKRDAFEQKLQDAKNINQRMATAYSRAEDEDRWPVVMGGRTFEKDKAKAIIEQTRKYVEDRQPLAEAYDQAASRLASAIGACGKDIESLNRLREKVALDAERVRLNKGMEELAHLKDTEAEIRGFTKALGDVAEESLSTSLPPDDKDTAKIDVDSLLK